MLHERIGQTVPLVVDLDHTLVTGDVAAEQLITLARGNLWRFLAVLWAALRGRAVLKTRLARAVPLDPARLNYRPEVLRLIAEAKAQRRPVVLATAAHWRNAQRVARHLGLFSGLVATTSRCNMKGATKLAAIRAATGAAAFDYVGDSHADRAIWQQARRAYTVDSPSHTTHEVRLCPRRDQLAGLVRATRPHQWAKNALVFVPLACSGQLAHAGAFGRAALAFAAMSLIASSVYLLNDVLDIAADRAHPIKRRRPLASGALGIPAALAASAALAIMGFAEGATLGLPALCAMACYFALTLAYSLRLKAVMIADVVTLASLYTLRIVAGAAVIGVPVSYWLALFSLFFFLSLGYLKRYVELRATPADRLAELVAGRAYTRSDTEIVAISGLAAGMVSILVLGLYAQAMSKTGTYGTPQLLWLLPMPVLYWLNRVWMMGRRGQVDSDPVAFAVTDPRSMLVGGCVGALLLVAKFAPMGGLLAQAGFNLG